MSAEENIRELTSLEKEVVTLFSDGVKVIGLPKSVGEIYGLLYVQKGPLALDDLVALLGVSKGTGSQGLKMLRTLGAVKEVSLEGSRRTFYEADVELKSLVGGFIREEVRPHLSRAHMKLRDLENLADEHDEFVRERLKKLNQWRSRADLLLPILQKILTS